MKEKEILVAGLTVLVWWKHVKNINLTVKGPNGRVRISVPWYTTERRVRQMIVSRMDWIEKQQVHFQKFPAAEKLQAISGEEHLFFGRSYSLDVVYGPGRHHVIFDDKGTIRLFVRPGTAREKRLQVIYDWYRLELAARIPMLVEHWQESIGEKISEWRIKRMKTRWGTCNIDKRRIWFNLELARKPECCLEYILVHEMVHLLERNHSRKFYQHLHRLFPEWRKIDLLLTPVMNRKPE